MLCTRRQNNIAILTKTFELLNYVRLWYLFFIQTMSSLDLGAGHPNL